MQLCLETSPQYIFPALRQNMPSIKQVAPLLNLSTNASLKALLPVLLSSQQQQARMQQIVKRCLPPRLLQHLLDAAILHLGDRSLSVSLVATLATDTTTELVLVNDHVDATIGLEECMAFYMTLYKNQVFALQHLAFSVSLNPHTEAKYLPVPNTFLYRPLQHMVKLCSFTMHLGADDTVLALLGKNCPLLASIDVSGSWLVTDEGIRALCWQTAEVEWKQRRTNALCSRLEKCIISNTRVGVEGIATLLFCIPGLKATGAPPNDGTMADVLKKLSENNTGDNVTHMRFSELFTSWIKGDDWRLLQQCLPNISAISAPVKCLERLHNFTNLNELSLDTDFRPLDDDFYYYLQIIGPQLHSLTLTNQIFAADFQYVIKCCPKLTSLDAYVQSVDDVAMAPANILQNVKLRFSSMETLSVFLKTSPELSKVQLSFFHEDYSETYSDFDDDFMASVLDCCGLVKVTSLHVESNCNLGSPSLFRLIQKCPKIQWIGDLHNWRVIDPETIEQLGDALRKGNWELDVIYYFSMGH